MDGVEKRILYIPRSDGDPSRHYVGITNSMVDCPEWHNHGPCGYTSSNRPWSVVVSMEFPTERAARVFERYLKSGSGRAFAKRHVAVEARTRLGRQAPYSGHMGDSSFRADGYHFRAERIVDRFELA